MKKSCDNAAARVVARYELASCDVWKRIDDMSKDALRKAYASMLQRRTAAVVTDLPESITDVFANQDSKPKALKVQLLALVDLSDPRDERDLF